MIRTGTLPGVYALGWDNVSIDGVTGLAPDALRVGVALRLMGPVIRLDGKASVLALPERPDHNALKARARQVAQRLTGIVDIGPFDAGLSEPRAGEVVLTDGHRPYLARLVVSGLGWLLLLNAPLPQPRSDLFVVALGKLPANPAPRNGVICFADDALILTDQGARPIDTLKPGDLVQTRDDGLQPILWVGRSRLSGMALRRHPQLRPVRLRAGALGAFCPTEDLRLSPAHRILVQGPRARALFNVDEVLVSAGDLVGQAGITQDLALYGVTYMHLLLERHQVLFANGVPAESFHPGFAAPDLLRTHKRDLAQAVAFEVDQPDLYGAPARRCLNAAEAALLAA
jgi:hypothetical protein